MKRYIGLLALCVLSNIAMEQEVQKWQVTLISGNGGQMQISREMAKKIPVLDDIIENFGKKAFSENVPLSFDIAVLQAIVNVVKEVYTNAPVLQEQYDPQFFERYRPADIPQQVRNIVNEQRGNIDQNVLLQAADYLGIDWMKKSFENPEGKSVADLVVYGELPEVENNIFNHKKLNLARSKLVSLVGIYLITEDIEDIDLSNNQISSIEPESFEELNNLVKIRLDQNKISSIEQKVFSGLPSLATLFISDNQIRNIKPEMFAGLQNLVFLDLEGNQIGSIEPGSFDGLKNLRQLYLDYNQIKIIKEEAFNGLHNLQELYLDHNYIDSIEPGAFDGLQNLILLGLDHIRIKSIEPGVFSGLPMLDELHLSHNQIKSIKQGAFDGLQNITLLGLIGNDDLSRAQVMRMLPEDIRDQVKIEM